MSCSNPNSCHPFLLTFGLITVFLMVFYLIRDTLFDNARPKKGPILSTFNTAKPRQPPVSAAPVSSSEAVKFTDEGADGFKALRYEDTWNGNLKRLEKGTGEGSSKGPVAPISEFKKPSQLLVREEADLACRSADFVEDSQKYENKWHRNVEHVEHGHGGRRSAGPELSKLSNEKPKDLDLEYRPASFVGEGPDGFQAVDFNPYTWHGDVKDLDKGKSEGISSEKV